MRRVAITWRVKLNKLATETFGILNNTFGEECLSRTREYEWHGRVQRKAQNVKMDMLRVEKMSTGSFYAKCITIHREFVPKSPPSITRKLY
jgi:hypothetical protein